MKIVEKFYSDFLPFVASASLAGKGVLVEAIPHPQAHFTGQLMYALSPHDVAMDLYRKFQRDELLNSPRQVANEIIRLKNLKPKEGK